MDEVSHGRVCGPLEPFVLGFYRELAFRGYTPGSPAQQLRLMERLSQWLTGKQLDVRGITAEQVQQFVSARREDGYRHWISPQALVPLLCYLRSLGALAAPPAGVLSPMEEILERYLEFMVCERALGDKRVSPHVLRHTAAMQLQFAGVDSYVIALWLGRESIQTTQIYLHADMSIKQHALDRLVPPNTDLGRYRAKDSLLAFLESL